MAGFAVATVLLRLPSFFEPPWHTDEGIFEAIAQKVVAGGRLYADAWESKPPLFLYLYVATIKLFGAGVLPLRLAAAVAAFGTELALFGVAEHLMGRRQALLAAGICAILIAVPFWDGNLALSEIFAILPTTLAVLCAVSYERRSLRETNRATYLLFLAGLLFGLACLIRQPMAVVAGGLALWLFVSGRSWLKFSLLIGIGAATVIVPVVLGFALFGSFHWFWDANVDFFFSYIPSGQELPFLYRPLILLPAVIALLALLVYRRRGSLPQWSLPALWLVLTLAAALLTGRPYSHYFIPVFPPLALLIALIAPRVRTSWRPKLEEWPAFALLVAITLLWLAVVRSEFGGNVLAMRFTKGPQYYANFAGRFLGWKSRNAYNDYFDRRVNLTYRLEETLKSLGAKGQTAYIWGEYPWVYPLSGTTPATRYTTSFYVLLIPYLDVELGDTLAAADPRFILVLDDAWPGSYDPTGILRQRYENATLGINGLIARRYEQVAVVGKARIFQRTLSVSSSRLSDREGGGAISWRIAHPMSRSLMMIRSSPTNIVHPPWPR